MLYNIGDWISFSYEAEKKKIKPGSIGAKVLAAHPHVQMHERSPTAIVLHPSWGGNAHCLLTNNYGQREINYLTAIIDPFFAAEIIKKDAGLRAQLQRLQKDLNITSPHDFYLRVVKPFIAMYDGYRLYSPQKMMNIRVIKKYSDIETRMKTSQTQGQEKQPEQGRVATKPVGSNFFQNYANTLSKMKGPRLK